MKKTLLILLNCLMLSVEANSGALLNQDGADIDIASKVQAVKSLSLDNPFVIQAFSTWRALGALNPETNLFMQNVLDKNHLEAFQMLGKLSEPKAKKLLEASELYLLFQLDMFQAFVGRFIEISSDGLFLQSELGLALDHVAGPLMGQKILEKGLFLTANEKKQMLRFENSDSRINYTLQAFKALGTGENALQWIGKLEDRHPLKIQLAETALLDFAKQKKLGASGKIVKSIIEPILNTTENNDEQISLYFMTLARLLYQAGALDEANKYYSLIPESSQYFLKAKSESLWASIRARDYSRTKGDLATLELNVFNKQFYPEVYLVSAMANVMLCQFVEARNAINRFVANNKAWAVEIEKNIQSKMPVEIENTSILSYMAKSEQTIVSDGEKVYSPKLQNDLKTKLAEIQQARREEYLKQWNNRQKLLETALYKMKFVRLELIARMRQVQMKMQVAGADSISVQQAANAKKNQLKFPHDGKLWSDDLFHMSAEVKNMCQRGEL